MNVAFGQPWDLHAVKPSFFPVPASVVFGERADASVPLAAPADALVGAASRAQRLMGGRRAVPHPGSRRGRGGRGAVSPYAPRFAKGATVFPRVLFVVETRQATALGTGAGRKAVRSQRSPPRNGPGRSCPRSTVSSKASSSGPCTSATTCCRSGFSHRGSR